MRIYLTLTHFYANIVLKVSNFEMWCVMKEIGIIKKFDNLGRLVIPKELRERLFPDGKVEIVATQDGVLIKSVDYELIKKSGKGE